MRWFILYNGSTDKVHMNRTRAQSERSSDRRTPPSQVLDADAPNVVPAVCDLCAPTHNAAIIRLRLSRRERDGTRDHHGDSPGCEQR